MTIHQAAAAVCCPPRPSSGLVAQHVVCPGLHDHYQQQPAEYEFDCP